MEDIKNFFNIIFFVVMCVLAVLSYLQAKKTLFSPIKAEIFKVQVHAFQEVLAFFNKQSSSDFDRDFDINRIFYLNAAQMRLDYVNSFFSEELEVDQEHVKQLRESAVGAFISAEFLSPIEPGIELSSDHVKQKSRLSPEMKLARWNEYVLSKVDFTHTFQEKMSELSKLASSPLLPKELTDLIYEFRGIVNGNVILIGKVISSAAKELPAKYSTANDVTLFRPEWIWNQYNSQRKDSSEVVGKILKYISDYLQVNKIMNK